VLSGRGLCDELITRPEESYRLWRVDVYDLETSRIGAPYIYDISNLRVKRDTSVTGHKQRAVGFSLRKPVPRPPENSTLTNFTNSYRHSAEPFFRRQELNKTPRILQNPQVHSRLYNSPPVLPILTTDKIVQRILPSSRPHVTIRNMLSLIVTSCYWLSLRPIQKLEEHPLFIHYFGAILHIWTVFCSHNLRKHHVMPKETNLSWRQILYQCEFNTHPAAFLLNTELRKCPKWRSFWVSVSSFGTKVIQVSVGLNLRI